jgi:hypothetical protein
MSVISRGVNIFQAHHKQRIYAARDKFVTPTATFPVIHVKSVARKNKFSFAMPIIQASKRHRRNSTIKSINNRTKLIAIGIIKREN